MTGVVVHPSYSQTIHSINKTVQAWVPVQWLRGTLVGQVLYTSYVAVVVYPLQQLYIRGWWNGRPMEDICAHLTNHQSKFWIQHPEECAIVIENNFDSWLVYTQFALYALTWLFVIRYILRRICP
jgi:hypothetical protein